MRDPASRTQCRSGTAAAIVFVVAGLLVAGCTSEGSGPTVAADPTASPTPSGVPAPAPDATAPTRAPQQCPQADAEQIADVIGSQLSAFVDGDFDMALEWATPGFRRSFPLEDFEAMITGSFPIPATASGHEVIDCQVIDDIAAVTVVVTGAGDDTQTLQYGLLQLPEGWRIDGAVPLEGPGAEVI